MPPRTLQTNDPPPESTNIIYIPADAEVMPDNPEWTNRFKFRSTSGHVYTIAQNIQHRFWGCGCKGWVMRKRCRHLEDFGLPINAQPYEAVLARNPATSAAPRRGVPATPAHRATTPPEVIVPPKAPPLATGAARRKFSLTEDV